MVLLLFLAVSTGAGAFDESRITASFGVISDVHVESPSGTPSRKFSRALMQLRDKAAEHDKDGLDGILIAGDLVNNPYSSEKNYVQMSYFKDVYESVFNPDSVALVYTPGNHDVFREWTQQDIAQAKNLSAILGERYFLLDLDQESREKLECRHCVIKGVHILTIFPVSRNPVTYLPEQKRWLDERLGEITSADPSAYVIILTHPMVTGTVYGSGLGDYWATEDLTPILSKYPQAVIFGGHLHFPLNDPRSIWQGDFTAVGCGSVRYMAVEGGGYEHMRSQYVMTDADEFSQGLLLQFDAEGNMRLTRMDFYHDRTIDRPWICPAPSADRSHLRGYSHDIRRQADRAPRLRRLSLRKGIYSGDGQEVKAVFASGKDDEFVHHYVLEMKCGDSLVCRKNILTDFYRVDDFTMMREQWEQGLGVHGPGRYTVTLTAFDSWGKSGKALVSKLKITEPD